MTRRPCKARPGRYTRRNRIHLGGSDDPQGFRQPSPATSQGRLFVLVGEMERPKHILDGTIISDGAPAPVKRTRPPASLANLRKPWQAGESGNPNGRPKDTPLVTPAIRRMLKLSWAEFSKLDPKTMKVADALAWRAIMDGLDDEGYQAGTKSREMIIDRVDGKQDKGDTFIQKAILVRYIEGAP